MSGELIYAFRVMRLPLLDAGGAQIGRLDDIVVIPGRAGRDERQPIAPRVVGFVASSQRRRIFVNANRIAGLDSDGARLRSWDVDLQPVQATVRRGADRRRADRPQDRRRDRQRHRTARARRQQVVVLGHRSRPPRPRKSTLRRRPSYRLVDYDEVPALFDAPSEMQAEAARLRDFHPAEVAAVVRALPRRPAPPARRGDGRRTPRRRARGAVRGRAGAHRRRTRPRPPRRRVRRDGVRRPRRPHRRDGPGRPGTHARA